MSMGRHGKINSMARRESVEQNRVFINVYRQGLLALRDNMSSKDKSMPRFNIAEPSPDSLRHSGP
jgi:hypothetical protein